MALHEGDQIELRVTPDRYVTVRYAGASGDFNPIHIDEEFARQVGLPGRILHGLWSMAQVARAATAGRGRGPDRAAVAERPVPRHGADRRGDRRQRQVNSVADGVATRQARGDSGRHAADPQGAVAELRVD